MKKHYVPKTINISKIVVDPFNPPARTADKTKLRELSSDIKKNGLLDEIKVRKPFKDEKKGCYYVFDGHRRLQALKVLKATKIDCFVYTLANKEEAERMYNSINSTSMKMTSAQYAYRWLMGCTIPKKHMQDIDLLSNWFGSKGEKFKQEVGKYCVSSASPVHHILTTRSYVEFFRKKQDPDIPGVKQILNASFKDPVFRTWRNVLFGRQAEQPISKKQVLERIYGAK